MKEMAEKAGPRIEKEIMENAAHNLEVSILEFL